jgi:hypothetical protein
MRPVILLMPLILLTGCFSSPPAYWQHKTIPSDQWNRDKISCTRAAEKKLGLENKYHADQGLSNYDEQMRLYEAGKKLNKMVAICMQRLGYVPVR